jgi:hypothetical protein
LFQASGICGAAVSFYRPGKSRFAPPAHVVITAASGYTNGMSIFEMLMLLFFAACWPVNIFKSLKTRSAKGKSLVFLFLIWSGYICGLVHKFLFSRDTVMVLYMINVAMVSVDIVLYFINRRRDLAAQSVPA